MERELEDLEAELSKLVERVSGPARRNLALAKKEAVWSLYARDNARILLMKTLAYFDASYTRAMKNLPFGAWA